MSDATQENKCQLQDRAQNARVATMGGTLYTLVVVATTPTFWKFNVTPMARCGKNGALNN